MRSLGSHCSVHSVPAVDLMALLFMGSEAHCPHGAHNPSWEQCVCCSQSPFFISCCLHISISSRSYIVPPKVVELLRAVETGLSKEIRPRLWVRIDPVHQLQVTVRTVEPAHRQMCSDDWWPPRT